ncbi:MAG TPA: hypothetical protein VHL78_11360 [Actinomycetota bacterium]|nr:hypothetical protein [Actinomycetota bacterium]
MRDRRRDPSRILRLLAVATVAVLLSVACRPAGDGDGSSDRSRPAPAPRPTRPPGGASITVEPGVPTAETYRPRRPAKVVFSSGPGVLDADRAFVETTVQQARRFFRSAYGPVLRGRIHVSVHASLDDVVGEFARRLAIPVWVARLRWKTAAALTARGPTPQATQVFFLLPRWGGGDAAMRAKVVFHEWFHVLQYQVPPPNLTEVDPDEPPRWLFEGSAEWWGLRAATALGWYPSFEAVQAGQRGIASLTDAPLGTLRYTVEEAGAPGYALSFTAMDLLVDRTGARSVARFWRTLPRASGVTEAFEDAFGTTLSAFHREFARSREAGYS